MLEVLEKVELSANYRNLIKKYLWGNSIQYNIISTPNKFFPGKVFSKVEQQLHGESDFVDQDRKKYEVIANCFRRRRYFLLIWYL